MRIGRIPYINCYPVYGAIDRGVVSAVEYARDADRYLLLPDLAISCDGPVRSVMLFSKRPAGELSARNVVVSKSSMTSVALLELLFESVWHARPRFIAGDADVQDVVIDSSTDAEARLVIG